MIWQRISVDIGCDCLNKNHFLVDQILNLVLEVDFTILSIMSNAVGVIRTPLIGSVEFGTSIHRLGPYWVNVSSYSQSLLQICSTFSKRGKVSGGILLESGSRGIIVALLGGGIC